MFQALIQKNSHILKIVEHLNFFVLKNLTFPMCFE